MKSDLKNETEKHDELLSKLSKIKEGIDDISEKGILALSTSDYKGIYELLKNDRYSEEFDEFTKKLKAFRKKE